MHGFIKAFDKQTGLGWIDTAGLKEDTVPFIVIPGSDYKVGDRVRFNVSLRAIQIEVDTEQLGERIG